MCVLFGMNSLVDRFQGSVNHFALYIIYISVCGCSLTHRSFQCLTSSLFCTPADDVSP